MKPFVFKLKTKLHLAELEEEQAREGLRHARARRDECIEALEKIKQHMNVIKQCLVDMMNGSCNIDQILLSKRYLPILKEQRAQRAFALELEEQKVELAETNLLEKNRELKTLIRFREKEWQEYRVEYNRQEQKILDELAINNHFRRKQL